MSNVIEDDSCASLEDLDHSYVRLSENGQHQKTKLLIVDDDSVNQIVLKGMLVKYGYDVVVANDGKQSIEKFREEQPDLILMDVMMPEMDGYEAAKRIKQESGTNYIPIMFLTAITDDEALAKCVESGGDDFLSKPYSPVILKARIDALLRTSLLYKIKQKQNRVLSLKEEEASRDLDIAERVLSKITRDEAFDVTNINYHLSPMEQLNGDIIIVAHKPDGGQIYLLGDFTGHGLGAAIGGMVVFDVFKSMAAKGFAMTQIISEINQKLREVMPTGRFLAAGLIELYAEHNFASVWNGGLPDIYLRRNETGDVLKFPSTHLPLGVLDTHELDFNPDTVKINLNDQFFLYSDGVIEAENKEGEFFGNDKLELCINKNNPEKVFSEILKSVSEFSGDCSQRDDLSLLEIFCDPEKTNLKEKKSIKKAMSPATHWSLDFKVEVDALKEIDFLPSLVQMIVDIQGLRHYQKPLYLILTELTSNALEHGLLDLDSHLKSTADGFEHYYAEREKALADLTEGSISFNLSHEPCRGGGKLTLRITHDGDGFDIESTQSLLRSNDSDSVLHGRGIKLVESLTQRLEYEDFGRSVEVDYVWQEE